MNKQECATPFPLQNFMSRVGCQLFWSSSVQVCKPKRILRSGYVAFAWSIWPKKAASFCNFCLHKFWCMAKYKIKKKDFSIFGKKFVLLVYCPWWSNYHQQIKPKNKQGHYEEHWKLSALLLPGMCVLPRAQCKNLQRFKLSKQTKGITHIDIVQVDTV